MARRGGGGGFWQMVGGVRDIDHGWKKYKEMQKKLDGAHVDVGLFSDAAPYARGSDGLRDLSRARPLTEILADLRRTQERLLGRLGRLSDADLAEPVKDGTVGSQLAFLHFHEAYHAGQVGLLRRLLGKEGAIR